MAENAFKPFFSNLRQGLNRIEDSVRILKQSSEKGFQVDDEEGRLEIIQEDKKVVKNIEEQVNSTYSKVLQLRSVIFNDSFDLDQIEHKLQDLAANLNTFTDKHNLEKYGYKPWVNPRPPKIVVPENKPLPEPQGNTLDENGNVNGHANGEITFSGSKKTILKTPEAIRSATTPKTPVRFREIEAQDIHERSCSDPSEESPEVDQQAAKTGKPSTPLPEAAPIPKPRKLLSNVRVDPLPEPQVPKPASIFAKRYTILPPCISNYVREKPVFQPPAPAMSTVPKSIPQTIPATSVMEAESGAAAGSSNSETFVAEPQPEAAAKAYDFSADTTTRFNVPMTSMHEESSMGSFMNNNNFEISCTPTRTVGGDLSLNNEQETIEFTPGLTTRRPIQRAVKRVREPQPELPAPTQAVEQITRSLKNVYMGVAETPTQPIPSMKLVQSIKAVKSVSKKFTNGLGSKVVPGTPQMPDSSEIEETLHRYMLRNKSSKK